MATARAGRHDGTTWVPSSSSCRSGCRLSAPRRCRRSRRRTCAAWRRPPTSDGHDAEALYHEVLGAFELAASRDGAPMAVRAFNPTLAEHGYEPGGSVVETNTEDLPFLVDSVSAELAGPRPGHRPRAAPDRRHRALGRRRHRARPASQRGAGDRVGHALRARPAPGARGPRRPRGRRALGAGRRAPRRARLPALRERVESVVEVAREGAARYDDDEVAEVVSFLEWLARDNFIFLGARDYELVDGALRVVARLRPGAARRRGALGLRQAGGGRDARPQPARAGAGRRAAAGLQDQPAVAGAPPRAHGLRRHPPRLGRRRDRRRGAHDRPLHDQGLRRARLRDARPAPQAAADPGQRGPDRGLARLQGRRLALRVLPQGRALRRAHRRPARRGRRAHGPAGRAGARARPPRRRRAHRVDHRRAAQGRLRRGAARAPARLPAPALRRQHGRRPRGAHRGRPRARALHHPPRPGRPARALAPRRRGRDPRARAHVGRPRPRRARRAPRRGARARAGQALDRAPARLLQGGRRPGRGGRRHRPLRAPVHRRRGLPRRPAQRARRAHAHRDVPRGRQGRALPGDADARAPRPARGRGAPHAAAGRRRRPVAAGLRRARPHRPAARPRGVRRARRAVHRRRLARRGGVGLAEPPDHQRRPGLAAHRDPARLPQVPPAHRLALHRELPERRDRGQPAHHGQAHPPLRAAQRPRDRARRGGRGRAARRHPRGPRGGALARPRPHPAQPARAHRGDGAHERLPPRPALDRLQAALGRRARDPAAAAAVRDLRLRARGRGDPPARRQDRPRRPALVGPHGLPHRGLRPHARADDQERGHRARRRQGRLLPAPAPRRPGRAEGRGRARLRDLHQRPARPHRQPRRGRGRAPRGRARARRRRHLPGRRRRQGHGDVLGHRQPRRRALRLLAGRRVRLGRLEGL